MAYAENQITLEVVEDGNEVFITEPDQPYDTGDLWVDSDTTTDSLVTDDNDDIIDSDSNILEAVQLGESTVYVCTNPSPLGVFNQDDWKPAASTADKKLREHFWHDDNGAHVLGDASGYRNDIDSTGMHIIDTTDESALAEFTATGAVIGKDGENRALIDAASFQIVDPEGTVQFATSATGATRTGTASRSVSMVSGTLTIKVNAASGATISYSIEDSDGVVQDSGSFTASVGTKINVSDVVVSVTATDASSTTIRTRNSTHSFLKFTYSWQTTYYIPQVETIGDCRVGEDLYVAGSKMVDFVVTEDDDSGWIYRQWKSGFIEAWYDGSVSFSATTAAGNVYNRTWSLAIPAAVGFTSAPHINVSYANAAQYIIGINGTASSTTAINGYAFRTASASAGTGYVSVYAWGY